MRLSQKAWNNVLIFSMLILIVVLNYDRLFESDESSSKPVVSEGDFIVSLQINQMTFERIGTGWRVTAPSADLLPDMQSDDIDRLVAQWQRAILAPSPVILAPEITASPSYLVSISVAGQPSAQIMGLLEVEGVAYVIYEGELYLLDFPTMAQLLPPTA
ncbi:hypothetical protein KJ365_13515 [Glaciecola sp. XM2]|uniref:hypothetical protein n=1 Tax=Glaciecola sp. XM2 TaxID=1914931 RepID=UPI001BDEB513|nr:hypothetical protein [Glaciecola sp. XM2]MBT1451905.1 hypothetical protein [Glaciecola sp. XM2]